MRQKRQAPLPARMPSSSSRKTLVAIVLCWLKKLSAIHVAKGLDKDASAKFRSSQLRCFGTLNRRRVTPSQPTRPGTAAANLTRHPASNRRLCNLLWAPTSFELRSGRLEQGSRDTAWKSEDTRRAFRLSLAVNKPAISGPHMYGLPIRGRYNPQLPGG